MKDVADIKDTGVTAVAAYIPPTVPGRIKIEAKLTLEEAAMLCAMLSRTEAGRLDALYMALYECPAVARCRLDDAIPVFCYADLIPPP